MYTTPLTQRTFGLSTSSLSEVVVACDQLFSAEVFSAFAMAARCTQRHGRAESTSSQDSSVRSSGVVPMANIVTADSTVETSGCLFLGARKPRVSLPLCGSRFFFFCSRRPRVSSSLCRWIKVTAGTTADNQ